MRRTDIPPLVMQTPKHIHNAVAHALRSIGAGLITPQVRAAKEILVGLLRDNTPILNHLNTSGSVRVSKQAERYRRHLENIDITEVVEERILRTLPKVEEDTVISYDLGDIAKPHSKKMEGMSGIFDGSKRRPGVGYVLHGVCIHNQPVIMELHDADAKFLPQVRKEVIARVSKKVGTNGIWVYDRQNDDKKLFRSHVRRKQRFVIRLKKNRKLRHVESGMVQYTADFLPGIYDVRVLGQRYKYILVVYKHHKHNDPIRVLVRGVDVETAEDITNAYLVRWDIENLYKQMKEKFQLEKIRLLSWKKLKNLLALIQLATSISNKTFAEMTGQTEDTTTNFELTVTFTAFCHHRSLTSNRFAFTSFLSEYAPGFQPRTKEGNPLQRTLLPRQEIRRLERESAEMGVF
jgi:hypothetical protein